MPGRLASRPGQGQEGGCGQIQARDHPGAGPWELEIGREARLEGGHLGVIAYLSAPQHTLTSRRVREGVSWVHLARVGHPDRRYHRQACTPSLAGGPGTGVLGPSGLF